MGIETLDPRNADDVSAVADIHMDVLGDSPVVGLGPRFLRDVFYGKLVEDGAVRVIMCRHEGQIIGFISYTPDPQGFMGKGIRKHFLYLTWVMSLSIVTKPALLKGILRALGMVRERSGESEPYDPRLGEVISLATRPGSQKHVPEGGTTRVAVRLFQEVIAAFRHLQYERIHLLVQPENRASNILCAAMGCRFEKITVGGKPTHRFTFVLTPADSATPGSAV
jgi:hypothetical protein